MKQEMQIEWNGQSVELPAGAVIGLIGTEADCAAFIQALGAPLRQAGSSVLFTSWDSPVLRQLSDEVWWIENGRVRQRGDVREVTASSAPALSPTMRRGDGRAEVLSIETVNAAGEPVRSFATGESAAVRIKVAFRAAVADPVIGIMIRTRIGMEVYGTNTELETLKAGPCAAGEERTVTFRFDCRLCPGYYTLTAASHDPDGVWHDWLEDAVGFMVSDTRYTAGVANLRATVELS